MNNEIVLQHLDHGLLTITMNRPDRRNALNPDMTLGLVAAARRAAEDHEVRAVLLKGAGGLRFMDERVPGVTVPPETIERVEQADDESEAAYELALEQARAALATPGIRGIHLTDFRRDGALSRLCHDLGFSPKEERHTHAHRSELSV